MQEQINSIIAMSEELAELPAGSYHSKCRKTAYNLCRLCANNLIMRELSIDYNVLSKYITSRDRATLFVQYENHRKNIEGWSHYKCFYEALKSRYLSNHKFGEYLDRDKFDTILYRYGVKTISVKDDEQKMCLTVSVGRFRGKIYRSPKSVVKTLKILLEAFCEYDYDIVINKVGRYERIYKIT